MSREDVYLILMAACFLMGLVFFTLALWSIGWRPWGG